MEGMIMNFKKAFGIAVFSTMVLCTTGFQAEAASLNTDIAVAGMPNPVVSCPSFEAVAESVHFVPLYLTRSSGYKLSEQSVIGGETAELKYTGLRNPRTTATVRTSRTDNMGAQSLSGFYTMQWQEETLNGTVVAFSSRQNVRVAYWSVNGWSFSAAAENMGAEAFKSLVTDSLLDMSVHSFLNLRAK